MMGGGPSTSRPGFAQGASMSPVRIMRVEIAAPSEFIVDLLYELKTVHARFLRVEPLDDGGIILADMPYRALLIYGKRLQVITRGKAFYSAAFSRYEHGGDDE